MNKDIKIIILGGRKESTNIIYNYLNEIYTVEKVIIEEPVNRNKFLKRRIKSLGISTVIGQILFQIFIIKLLKIFSKSRVREISGLYDLDTAPIPNKKTLFVSSVNSKESIAFLQEINGDIVIVNGTRIISKKVFLSVKIPFINTHVGITPLYRGVHGAYWALVNNDRNNCGVTVHMIDEGIDTGGILAQKVIKITAKDNFITYPLIQLGTALPLLKEVICKFKKLNEISAPQGDSKLWSHPTIFQYLYFLLFRSVK